MTHLILRGMFLLMAAAVAGIYALKSFPDNPTGLVMSIIVALAISGVAIAADILTPRKKLSAIAGIFLGLLAGLLAAYALSFFVDYVKLFYPNAPQELIDGIKLLVGVLCVFIATSLVLQTKDDFRFILPYVEFAKQFRGTRPMVLDTSAVIDGRILDIGKTRVLQGLLVVPRFVLHELQTIADSADKLKRVRGRRGLDILAKLQADPNLDVVIEDAAAEGATVDQQLVSLAQDLHARLMTTDFNLTKIARLRGVEVVNINELAESLRPVVLPGEVLSVKIVKPGESPNQGVGYLEDGTMVVVEHARDHLGQDVALTVTSSLQTSAGRMIFGRLAADDAPRRPVSQRSG
jgi:uncharacterized protein YacL